MRSTAPAVTPFRRNFLEVAAALGFIVLGTVIAHVTLSWWPALAGLI
jgi:hypothetical protein